MNSFLTLASSLKVSAADKAAAKKRTTITCIKGKLIKKATAVNPKCPTGYTKKWKLVTNINLLRLLI